MHDLYLPTYLMRAWPIISARTRSTCSIVGMGDTPDLVGAFAKASEHTAMMYATVLVQKSRWSVHGRPCAHRQAQLHRELGAGAGGALLIRSVVPSERDGAKTGHFGVKTGITISSSRPISETPRLANNTIMKLRSRRRRDGENSPGDGVRIRYKN